MQTAPTHDGLEASRRGLPSRRSCCVVLSMREREADVMAVSSSWARVARAWQFGEDKQRAEGVLARRVGSWPNHASVSAVGVLEWAKRGGRGGAGPGEAERASGARLGRWAGAGRERRGRRAGPRAPLAQWAVQERGMGRGRMARWATRARAQGKGRRGVGPTGGIGLLSPFLFFIYAFFFFSILSTISN
jgi:hypothetical protein